ncbi:unnamed protein product, partial [Ectocarpus sp. 13 AM-2016]
SHEVISSSFKHKFSSSRGVFALRSCGYSLLSDPVHAFCEVERWTFWFSSLKFLESVLVLVLVLPLFALIRLRLSFNLVVVTLFFLPYSCPADFRGRGPGCVS